MMLWPCHSMSSVTQNGVFNLTMLMLIDKMYEMWTGFMDKMDEIWIDRDVFSYCKVLSTWIF